MHYSKTIKTPNLSGQVIELKNFINFLCKCKYESFLGVCLMLNAYQDMFSAHYYEIPDGYKLKMRINDMHGANQKRYLPTPKLASIQKAAKSAGFDKKVVFTNLGLAGVTKFYKYKDYGEPKEPWIHERDCLNSGGVLPQIHDISELTLLMDVRELKINIKFDLTLRISNYESN